MLQALLDNSILIIFLVTASIIGYTEVKKRAAKSDLTLLEYLQSMRAKLNVLGQYLLFKLATAGVISFVISIVSFRDLWMNDVFHIVFVGQLLYRPVKQALAYLFE